MSTVNETIVNAESSAHVVQWTGLAAGDDGRKAAFGGAADRSAQVSGTFGGATVTIQGSNDGVSWFTLTDPYGDPLQFVAAGLGAVVELTRYVRPLVTGGDGTTALNVYMMAKR